MNVTILVQGLGLPQIAQDHASIGSHFMIEGYSRGWRASHEAIRNFALVLCYIDDINNPISLRKDVIGCLKSQKPESEKCR